MGKCRRGEGLREESGGEEWRRRAPNLGTGKARPPKQAVAEEERNPEPPKQTVDQREEEGRLPLLVRKLDTLKRDAVADGFTMAAEGRDVITVDAAAGLNQALVSQCSLVTL